MLRELAIAAAAAIVANASSAAHASVVTTFTYSGQAQAGGSTSASISPGFPSGGVLRANDPFFSYASAVGNGTANPLVFNAGAASVGKASASSNLTVSLQITNTSRRRQTANLGALIFAGAVGIANPNLADPSCSTAAIEACGAFLNGTQPVHAGEFANLQFDAQLDGSTLFGGNIAVDSGGMTSSFSSGFSLTNFGLDPTNGSLFSWQDTLLSSIDLGTFAPGQTKTLTYIVSASVATSALFPCMSAPFQCPLALSGFGDPPPGSGGVIITSSISSVQLRALQTFQTALAATANTAIRSGTPLFSVTFDPTPIPLPPAVLLFGAGIAALGAARRRKAG